MRERRFSLREEEMLDITSSKIEHHVSSLKEVQNELREIMQGRSLLLVDNTLDLAVNRIKQGMDALHEVGWGELAKLYLQKLFGSKIPESTHRLFQDFLGKDVGLRNLDIRDYNGQELDQSISAVIFSGSPADVTEAMNNPTKEIRSGITHGHIFKCASELYAQAVEEQLPVMGICFGHQMITHEQGGHVFRNSENIAALQPVEPTEYGAELLVGVFGEPLIKEGVVPAFHKEAVHSNEFRSALILHTSDRDPQLVHGLVHTTDEQFTGDAKKDANIIKTALENKRHVAVTIQGHPELVGQEAVMRFAIKRDGEVFTQSGKNHLAKDMLHLFTTFLKNHGKFKSS